MDATGESGESDKTGELTRWGLLLVVFSAGALLLLEPARNGPFVSDDLLYVAQNPHIQQPSPSSLLDILDPFGEAARHTYNYAPVHLLAHTLEWQLFGDRVTGYHVVNALLHALASALLAGLLVARGLPFPGAAAVGVLFLVHPANVEAAAWISQLKSLLGLVLALAALRVLPRRPVPGAVLFALAVLAKPQAGFALPMAAAFAWIDAPDAAARRRWALGLALCSVAMLAYVGPQLATSQRLTAAEDPLHPDAWVQARTVISIAARYLAMSTTSYGTSTFHDPPRALAATDAWWLAGAALALALAWRTGHALVRRREEGAWWIGAAAGYAPISQVVPFLQPMADRYLYFILPGLLGAAAFALRDALGHRRLGRSAMAAALAILVGVVVLFALRAHQRARVWRSSISVTLDSAAHYPNGMPALIIRAQSAALRGDVETAVRELRAAVDRGYDRFLDLDGAPQFAGIRGAPAFRALIRDMAGDFIELSLQHEHPTQADLRMRAIAYSTREEYAQAVATLEAAARTSGSLDVTIRAELAQARAGQRRAERAAGSHRPEAIVPEDADQTLQSPGTK